jgi:hypothetical protein
MKEYIKVIIIDTKIFRIKGKFRFGPELNEAGKNGSSSSWIFAANRKNKAILASIQN